MKFPTGRTAEPADLVCRRITRELSSLTRALTLWRIEVASGTIKGGTSREAYQATVAARNYVESVIGLPNLAAWFRSLYSVPVDFDPVATWQASKPAIDAFETWFKTSWPHLTANGHPAFEYFLPNGELADITINLGAPGKALILAKIDAVLEAIE